MGSRSAKVLNSGVVGSTNGSSTAEARTRRFGVFELDLRAGELRRSGMKVKLQEQPFQVLAQLLENPGEVVTREDLRNRLWPADTFVDFDHSLNAAIKRLRDALGDTAENPRFVETVARRGYRFLAPVSTTLANGNGAEQSSTIAIPSAEIATRPTGRFHLWWIIAGGAAVILVLLGIKVGLSLAPYHPPVQPRISRLTANPADDRVRAAEISRDGKYLAFSDETGFYLRQIDTGETHPVSLPNGLRPRRLSWFPDSAHMVAALDGPDQDSSLWEISTLGGNARKLADEGRLPEVSPDGKEIAFITGKRMNESVWLMGVDGTQPRKLVGEEGDFFGAVAWSPDGTQIAYTRGRFSYAYGVKGMIELVDPRDGHVSSLLPVNGMGWFASLNGPLAWAADGHLIYSLSEPPPRQLDSNLWALNLDQQGKISGAPLRLTNDAGSVLSISTSVDGKRMAYLKGVPQPDVYVARLEGHEITGEPQRLTLDDRQDIPFDWTPDGKAVLFISDRSGIFSLYRQAIDQTVPELLVGGDRPVMIPRLSPDGTQLLYLVYPNWSGTFSSTSLMRMPLAGGPRQQIFEGRWISNQQCARAPATLCVYSVVSDGQLTWFSFDPLKGNGSQIYQMKDALPQAYNWTLSPDGTTLAIAKGKQSGDEPGIRLVSLNTSSEEWVPVRGWPGVASIDWAADSKSLWAASVGEEENALLNVDLQGHVRVVWRPRKMNVGWAIPSRDGRYLALHVGSSSANVWMVERP